MGEVRKVVLWTTGILIALMVIASVILSISMASIKMPSTPLQTSSTNGTEQDAKAKEIANYKETVSSLQAQRTNVYDFVVFKTLLPLFNSLIVSVLGYVFARTLLNAYKAYIARKKSNEGQFNEL